MSIRALGLYEDKDEALAVIQRLLDEGVPRDRIHLVTSARRRSEFTITDDASSEGTAAGVAVGAGVGGIVTLAIAATGALPLAFVVGAATIAGSAGVGRVLGSNRDPQAAEHFRQEVENGKVMVAVELDSDGEANVARDLFADSGALEYT